MDGMTKSISLETREEIAAARRSGAISAIEAYEALMAYRRRNRLSKNGRRGRPTHLEMEGAPSPEEIRASRKKSGLTQEEASYVVGASAKSWFRWERGEVGMHPDIWAEWQKVFRNVAKAAI